MKGAIAKEEVKAKILETFENCFVDDKVLRIPWKENGEDIQIKITLTAAKDIVTPTGESVVPAAPPKQSEGFNWDDDATPAKVEPPVEDISVDEQKNISNLLAALF